MVIKAPSSESEILDQLIIPLDEDVDPQAARGLLRVRFNQAAIRKVNQLLRKNSKGAISAEERLLLEKYLHIGKLIDVIHARARKVLKLAGESE